MLQEKVRILVESPLYFASDMLDNDLLAPQSRSLQIIHRQFGMYKLYKAAQVNMRRSLLNKLNEKSIGVASLTCGIYM